MAEGTARTEPSPNNDRASRRSAMLGRLDSRVLGVVPIVTTIVVLAPIAFLILSAFSEGNFRGTSTKFTFSKFAAAYTDHRLLKALGNSLLLGVEVAVISTALTLPMAFLLVRTNMPLRRFFTRLMTMAFYMSPLFLAVAYVAIGAPRAGLLSQIARTIDPSSTGFGNIYTYKGIVFVQVLYYIPVSFLLISGALSAASQALEDAAHMSRASHLRTFLQITVPLIAPTLIASLLQVGVFSAEDFVVPYFLGLRSNFNTLPTQIYSNLSVADPDYNKAAAAGTMLLWFTAAAIFLFRRYSRMGDRYAALGGKASSPRIIALGKWRWPATALIALYLFLAVGAPILALVWGSLFRFPNRKLSLDGISGYNWSHMFDDPQVVPALRHTLEIAIIGALVTVLFCLVVSFVIVRTKARGRALVDYASSAPLAIPSLVLALGFLSLYLYLPIPIYGTLFGLGLAYAIRYMGFGVRSLNAGLQQVHSELTEAAYMCRASGSRVIRTIQFPMLRPTIANTWVVLFVRFALEVNITILLYTQTTNTLPVVIFNQLSGALLNSIYPLTLLLIAMTFIAVEVVRSIPGYSSEVDYTTRRSRLRRRSQLAMTGAASGG